MFDFTGVDFRAPLGLGILALVFACLMAIAGVLLDQWPEFYSFKRVYRKFTRVLSRLNTKGGDA